MLRDADLQVKYKEVMKEYNLGPNGGILTSLNLFATRFDQVSCLSPPPPPPRVLILHYVLKPALRLPCTHSMPDLLITQPHVSPTLIQVSVSLHWEYVG